MSSPEELSIPTPWGTISAKAWGQKTKPRVLAIHGFNDNAASFDQLGPQLEDELYMVCVDLPGHGLSTHFPPGLMISLLDYVTALYRVFNHLTWQQCSLLAHSLGSHIALYFSALFGQQVTQIFLIDAFFANIIPEEKFIVERCQVSLDNLFKVEKFGRNLYSFDETLKKLCEDRQTTLGKHCITALQKRAYKETGNGYMSNNDVRIKLLTYPIITSDLHFSLIKAVNCQVVVIATTGFEPFLSTPTTKETLKVMTNKLGLKMKTLKLEGCHDIHMEQPQTIVPVIKKFLAQPESHL